MSKVIIRTKKQFNEIIKGNIFITPCLQGCLLNLSSIRRRKPKQAFDSWKEFINTLKNSLLLDRLRTMKMQFTLVKMSTRVLRDCIQRILGEGNKIKGALLIYLSAIFRRPKNAFDK